jgi:hypothetical protein
VAFFLRGQFKLPRSWTKRSRLSFKEGTDEYKVLDQVIKCWFAKEGEYWPGQSVGTRGYPRHIEAKTHPWPDQAGHPRALPQEEELEGTGRKMLLSPSAAAGGCSSTNRPLLAARSRLPPSPLVWPHWVAPQHVEARTWPCSKQTARKQTKPSTKSHSPLGFDGRNKILS